jgi:hypothetical protein
MNIEYSANSYELKGLSPIEANDKIASRKLCHIHAIFAALTMLNVNDWQGDKETLRFTINHLGEIGTAITDSVFGELEFMTDKAKGEVLQ